MTTPEDAEKKQMATTLATPGWEHIERLLREELTLLSDVRSIVDVGSSDMLALECRARQLAHERLQQFLSKMGFLKKGATKEQRPYQFE